MRPRGKDVPRVDRDDTIGGKTIKAAVNRTERIEFEHVWFEPGNFVGANIRRISHDEIAAGRYCGAKIASDECGARRDAQKARIFAGEREGRTGSVDADCHGVWQF